MLELSHLNFPAIGSIVLPQSCESPSTPTPVPSFQALPPLGPLMHPCFYIEGRAALSMDRGPFPTARAYFLACAERESAATSALLPQGAAPAGAEYQALLAGTLDIVKRAVALLIELVRRCEGLDSADPELARYALDLHELGLKNIIVAPNDPTRIVRSFFPPSFVPSLNSNRTTTSLAGAHRLAIGVRSAVVALWAHAVLALALTCR
jgi:hypothetical protein